MKRRGFIQALFGAPVAAVAGKALAELPEAVRAIESEPEEAMALVVDDDGFMYSAGVASFNCSATCIAGVTSHQDLLKAVRKLRG